MYIKCSEAVQILFVF